MRISVPELLADIEAGRIGPMPSAVYMRAETLTALLDVVEGLQKFCGHHCNCPRRDTPDGECLCGLTDLLALIGVDR